MEKEESLEKYVLELKAHIEDLTLINFKLAYATNLFSSFYMTKEEKNEIAEKIDSCKDLSSIESVFKKYEGEFNSSSTSDNKMSPNFSRELTKIYSDKKGVDLSVLSDLYKPIGALVKNLDILDGEGPGSKRDAMEKYIPELRVICSQNNLKILDVLANL